MRKLNSSAQASFVESNISDKTQPNKEAGKKGEESLLESFNSPKIDKVKIILSFGISWATFYVFRNLLLDGIDAYWLRSLAALMITFIFLGAIRAALSKPSIISVPLTIFLFFWFFLGIFLTYSEDNPKSEKEYKTGISTKSSDSSPVKDYYAGDKPYFKLGAGESGPRIRIPGSSLIQSELFSNGDFIIIPEGEAPIYVSHKGSAEIPKGKPFIIKAPSNKEVLVELVIS